MFHGKHSGEHTGLEFYLGDRIDKKVNSEI